MSRRKITDHRAQTILAAFDYVAANPDRCASDMCSFMYAVVDTGCERFQIPGGWSLEGMRAVLVAFLVNAPDSEMAGMVSAARRELRLHRDWQKQRAYEKKHGYAPKGCIPLDAAYHPDDRRRLEAA